MKTSNKTMVSTNRQQSNENRNRVINYDFEIVRDFDGTYYVNARNELHEHIKGLPEYLPYKELKKAVKEALGVTLPTLKSLTFEGNGRKRYANVYGLQGIEIHQEPLAFGLQDKVILGSFGESRPYAIGCTVTGYRWDSEAGEFLYILQGEDGKQYADFARNIVPDNNRAELRRAERLASDCEAASLENEQEIREQADRWTDIRTGDRVWCKHYKTMGTVTDVVTYYGSLRYHVSYDAPVRTTDRQNPKEVSDTKGGLGYLRCGITKNYNEQGEREGTALYYAEQLRYGICNRYDFVFGAVSIKTKGTHNNLKNDNKNGWGVIYEVEISDGLGEAATYTMDIMQAANLLATLYAQDKGTDADLYKASEITDENEAARLLAGRAACYVTTDKDGRETLRQTFSFRDTFQNRYNRIWFDIKEKSYVLGCWIMFQYDVIKELANTGRVIVNNPNGETNTITLAA